MLPQDITQTSLESRLASAEPAGRAVFAAKLDSALQEMGSSMKSLEVLEDGQRRATRSHWLVIAILGLMVVAIGLLLSLGR